MNEMPFVSAMIVYRNEEQTIEKALRSLIVQDYPRDKYEIILIDGMSDDKSQEIIERLLKENPDVTVRILQNKKKILAAGWNLGIQNAVGEYVFRIDAHSTVEKEYIKKCLKLYKELVAKIACVGGTIVSESLAGSDEAVSQVLSSPFGVGNSKFRYSTEAGFVDTVAFGMYKKEIFEDVGYFDETLVRNQDIDIHSRMRDKGYKFYLDPSIHVVYYARNNLKSMLKQGFQNGKWVLILLKRGKSKPSVRHMIPLVFVTSMVILGILSIFSRYGRYLLATELGMHIVCGLYFALKKKCGFKNTVLMPIYFMLLHLAYGIGSLVGLIKKK